jgi:hypothetical protein
MACTVVTAYYDIKSKFNKSQYLEWGKTFMKLQAPIVLFTEEHLIPELETLRENIRETKIKFIPIPFSELDAWILYKDKWIEHHAIDPENAYHTPELYTIWAQKAFFVERAIKSNYFNTDYFFWCDFGAFRNPNIDNIILETFPQITYFKDNKLLLQSVGDLTESEKILTEDGIHSQNSWNNERLVGGLWGGSIIACLEWKRNYQIMLEKYFSKNIFAGKDQIVMLSTYLQNPTLALVVKSTLEHIDIWFFLEYLLSNSAKYELNNTYQRWPAAYIINYDKRPIISVNIMGGLGNQMFQLASAYAYSKHNNGKLIVLRNKKEPDGRVLYWDNMLYRFKEFLVDTLPEGLEQWRESGPTEFCIIPSLPSNGIFLNGYLQSALYFGDSTIQEEIKELFKPSHNIISNIQSKYNILLKNRERIVIVHARRTDYLKSQDNINFHGPLSIDYYNEAIKKMLDIIEDPIFVLAADDPSFWGSVINELPQLNNRNIYILNDNNEISIIALLQQFQYFIIANSTFSWWAAWLSKDTTKVIAPSKWFGPTGPQNYKDIYMPSWELI